MPETHQITFSQGTSDNQTNARTDNTNLFYVDDPKYSELELYSPQAVLVDYGTVLGISVILEEAGHDGTSGEESTFETALFHLSDDGFTNPITTTVTEPSSAHGTGDSLTVGGTTNLWGKSWTATDINNIRLKLYEPIEVGNVNVALRGYYVYLNIYYSLLAGKVQLNSGFIELKEGKVIL